MNINNKGFTMVELLAAVAILAIITGLAISGVSRILSKAHEEYYKSTEKNLVLAAQSYVQSNKSKLPKIIGKKTKITAKQLREANYLKSDLTTYNGKTKCDEEKTYVNVFKYGKSDYSYTAYLTCKPDREAKEQLKDDTPTLDVKFPGNYEELRTANVTIDIQGSGDSTVKLLSYSYALYYYDNNTNKYVQLMSSGSVESRQLSVSKTINLSKYTLHGSKRIKVVVSATNINGNSKSGAFMNDYQDKTPPSCDIKDVDKPNTPKGVKKWVNDKRTITVGCDDHDGSGCEKEKYTKTFTNNSITGFITIKDVEGNTRKCEVTTYIDKTAPTLTVNIYKANSHGNKTGDGLTRVPVNTKNNTSTMNWSTDSDAVIGKYTCNNTSITCETPYYILSKRNDTRAEALILGQTTNYAQIGVSIFNSSLANTSLSAAGYMYGPIRSISTKTMTNSGLTILSSKSSSGTNFYYGDTISYSGGEYYITNQDGSNVTQLSWDDN